MSRLCAVMRVAAGIALSCCGLVQGPKAFAAEPAITGLSPITLVAGPNQLPRFSQDGREALITLGWRDNGNAHGYDLYLVMLPTKPGAGDWNVVGSFPAGFE